MQYLFNDHGYLFYDINKCRNLKNILGKRINIKKIARNYFFKILIKCNFGFEKNKNNLE